MRRVYEAYPEDHEAATFYALSILGTAHEGRDFATYMRAAAVLEQVWDENPKHPGAAHYLIHSYDDPIHAPLGLPMGRAYSRIAPAAAHAQHMTSHIFVALGMWADVVAANEIARDVQNARRVELGQRPGFCGHYPYWLEYGYLQQGRFNEAAKVMGACFKRIQDDPTTSERRHFAVMRARYVLDTEDWEAADRWAALSEQITRGSSDYHFTTAMAAIKSGEAETALRSLKAMRGTEGEQGPLGEEEVVSILEREIQALLALKEGKAAEAVRLLRQAVRMEIELPYEFGPPSVVKPTSELLGEVLLSLGRMRELLRLSVNSLSERRFGQHRSWGSHGRRPL